MVTWNCDTAAQTATNCMYEKGKENFSFFALELFSCTGGISSFMFLQDLYNPASSINTTLGLTADYNNSKLMRGFMKYC